MSDEIPPLSGHVSIRVPIFSPTPIPRFPTIYPYPIFSRGYDTDDFHLAQSRRNHHADQPQPLWPLCRSSGPLHLRWYLGRRRLAHPQHRRLPHRHHPGAAAHLVKFCRLTGQTADFAAVSTTLITAALFTPLRQRVQAVIDRRLFRQKYNADQALARFAVATRGSTDLDALTALLTEITLETLQPTEVRLDLIKKG
jgi:hypothetical protein